VEGRTPFLDREVAAFAATLPDRLRANPRHGKVLLRHWLAAHAPETEPFARKRGFNPPVGRWMHARRAEIAPRVARQTGVAAFASPAAVAAVFEQAREAPQPAWSLLYYALWYATRIEGRAADGDIARVLDG
jgi:asparagine synthase (glutamine-hydrolysing)